MYRDVTVPEDSVRRGKQIRTNLNELFSPETPAIVYAKESLGGTEGKTAHRVISHSDLFHIVGVLDSHFNGEYVCDADDRVLHDDIPVFELIEHAIEVTTPEVLIIGTAPLGGELSEELITTVETALEYGIDVLSGLHEHLSEDKQLSELAEENKCQIYDIRKSPPESELSEADGRPDDIECTVVAVMGTDCVTGKGTTTYELYRAAKSDGLDAAYVATGQTGIITGSSYGIPTDKIPTEYVVGAVEDVVHAAAVDHEWIFVEGQAALSHPRFVGDDILKGSQPDYVVLADDPERDTYVYFEIQKAGTTREIELIENIIDTEVVAISSWNVDSSAQATQADVVVANVLESDGAQDILFHIRSLPE